MSDLVKAFDRLFKRTKVKRNLLGFLRATEVTVEEKEQAIIILTCISCLWLNQVILIIKKIIFQSEWTEMWEQSAKLDYTPIVNIKAVKNKDTDVFDKDGLKKINS